MKSERIVKPTNEKVCQEHIILVAFLVFLGAGFNNFEKAFNSCTSNRINSN
jgi:hypothetical protein